MIQEYPEYCERFSCIAGACPDTCCAGWEVDVDEGTAEYYRKAEGKIGEKIRAQMKESEDGPFFPLTEAGRCPFLDKAGLCEIYSGLGEESLCQVCTEYPRYFMALGNYMQVDMSLSCPELSRIFFAEKGMPVYVASEDDADGDPLTDEEAAALQRSLDGRGAMLELIGREDGRTLAEKLSSAGALQRETDEELLSVLGELEVLGPWWPELLEKLKKRLSEIVSEETVFEKHYGPEYSGWEQRLAAYFVFRYYIDHAVFAEDKEEAFVPENRLMCRSLRLIRLMCVLRFADNGSFSEEDMADIAHLYSRQVEHSEENVDRLKQQ